MVAIDLIVQHVHSQLEEVSYWDADSRSKDGATVCQKQRTSAPPATLISAVVFGLSG